MAFKIQYNLKPYIGMQPEIEFDKLIDFNQSLISYHNMLVNAEVMSFPEIDEKTIKWESIEKKMGEIKSTLSEQKSHLYDMLNVDADFFNINNDDEIKKILDVYEKAVEVNVNNLTALNSFFEKNIVSDLNVNNELPADSPLFWLLSKKIDFLFEALKISSLDSGEKVMEIFPLEFFNYLLKTIKCSNDFYDKAINFLFSFKKYFSASENIRANFSGFFSKNKKIFFDNDGNFAIQYENIYKQSLFDFTFGKIDESQHFFGNKLFFSEIKQDFFIENNKVKIDSIENFSDHCHGYAVNVINESFLTKIAGAIYFAKNSACLASDAEKMLAEEKLFTDEKLDFINILRLKSISANEFKFNKKKSVLDLFSHVSLISDFMTDYRDRFLIFKFGVEQTKISLDNFSKIHKYLLCYETCKKINFLIKANRIGENINRYVPTFLADLLSMIDPADHDFFFSKLRPSFDDIFLNKDRKSEKFNNELFTIRCGNILSFSSDTFLVNAMLSKDGIKYVNDFLIDYSIFLEKLNMHIACLKTRKYIIDETQLALAFLSTTLIKRMMMVFFIKNKGESENLNEVKKLTSPIFNQWEKLIQALDNNEIIFKKNNSLYFWIKNIYFLTKEPPAAELTNTMKKNIKNNGDLFIFFNNRINAKITKILQFAFKLDENYSIITSDKYEAEFKFINDLPTIENKIDISVNDLLSDLKTHKKSKSKPKPKPSKKEKVSNKVVSSTELTVNQKSPVSLNKPKNIIKLQEVKKPERISGKSKKADKKAKKPIVVSLIDDSSKEVSKPLVDFKNEYAEQKSNVKKKSIANKIKEFVSPPIKKQLDKQKNHDNSNSNPSKDSSLKTTLVLNEKPKSEKISRENSDLSNSVPASNLNKANSNVMVEGINHNPVYKKHLQSDLLKKSDSLANINTFFKSKKAFETKSETIIIDNSINDVVSNNAQQIPRLPEIKATELQKSYSVTDFVLINKAYENKKMYRNFPDVYTEKKHLWHAYLCEDLAEKVIRISPLFLPCEYSRLMAFKVNLLQFQLSIEGVTQYSDWYELRLISRHSAKEAFLYKYDNALDVYRPFETLHNYTACMVKLAPNGNKVLENYIPPMEMVEMVFLHYYNNDILYRIVDNGFFIPSKHALKKAEDFDFIVPNPRPAMIDLRFVPELTMLNSNTFEC